MKKSFLSENNVEENLLTLVLCAGAFIASFFTKDFIGTPMLGWYILLLTYFILKLKPSKKNIAHLILSNLMKGASAFAMLTIFFLSTKGETGIILGNIPESNFIFVIQNISWFFASILGSTSLLVLGLTFLEQKHVIKAQKLALPFMITSIGLFILMIANIKSFIPWLKPYDFVLMALIIITLGTSIAISPNKASK